jgi:hypothetical protein
MMASNGPDFVNLWCMEYHCDRERAQFSEQHVGFDGSTFKNIQKISNNFRNDAKTLHKRLGTWW